MFTYISYAAYNFSYILWQVSFSSFCVFGESKNKVKVTILPLFKWMNKIFVRCGKVENKLFMLLEQYLSDFYKNLSMNLADTFTFFFILLKVYKSQFTYFLRKNGKFWKFSEIIQCYIWLKCLVSRITLYIKSITYQNTVTYHTYKLIANIFIEISI